MDRGICQLPVIPMRREPSHESEMVSQMLFGETFTVVENAGDWWKVRCTLDQYEGFVRKNQVLITEEPISDFEILGRDQVVKTAHDIPVMLPAGCLIYRDAVEWQMPENIYEKDIRKIAMSFLFSPYLWGGKTRYGMDCSGYTQIVMRIMGKYIPRDAWQQAETGTIVNFIHETLPGDLAFFDNEEGKVSHTGIIMGNGNILHAHGMVRIDKVDHQGIFSEKEGRYTHSLRLIKRLL